jgi:hypothetical protein
MLILTEAQRRSVSQGEAVRLQSFEQMSMRKSARSWKMSASARLSHNAEGHLLDEDQQWSSRAKSIKPILMRPDVDR